MSFHPLLEVLACPACGGSLRLTELDSQNGLAACEKCSLVFPRIEGVHVFLVPSDAFLVREQEFGNRFAAALAKTDLAQRFTDRLKAIEKQSTQTWEKEDVEYWDKQYGSNDQVPINSPRPNTDKDVPGQRLYRRNKLFLQRLKPLLSDQFWLLEVGSGEGDSIQRCLNPGQHAYNYVASDYSFYAVRNIARRYAGLPNVHAVQCTGSRLPFRKGSLDTILLFGILHHMPRKEEELPSIFPHVKKGGHIAAFEGFERKSRLGKAVATAVRPIVEPNYSAHEERINRDRFMELAKNLGEVELYQEEHTILLTALITVFGAPSTLFWTKAMFAADDAMMKTLGRVSPFFGGGTFYALLRA